MPYCIYPGCKNSSNKKYLSEKQLIAPASTKWSYHKFPRHPGIRKKWSVATGLAECYIAKSATVCSDHFMHDDYRDGTKYRFLKETAVPSPYQSIATTSTCNDVQEVRKVQENGREITVHENIFKNISYQSIVTASTCSDVQEVRDVQENEREIKVRESTSQNIFYLSNATASTCSNVQEVHEVQENVQERELHECTSKNISYQSIATASTCSDVVEVCEVQENVQEIVLHESTSQNISYQSVITDTPSRRNKRKMRDACTVITPSRLFNSPTKKMMREIHEREVAMLKRQLNNVSKQLARYKKKIDIMNILLMEKKSELIPCTCR